MKVLGIIFSSRKYGNCARCTEYCLSEICKSGYEGDLIEAQEVKNKLSIFAEKIIKIS